MFIILVFRRRAIRWVARVEDISTSEVCNRQNNCYGLEATCSLLTCQDYFDGYIMHEERLLTWRKSAQENGNRHSLI